MKKCVGFIVMVVLLTTMSTSVYAKDRISYGKAYSYPTNDLEQWRFIFIDKDPKWTKLKTIQGQPKNVTFFPVSASTRSRDFSLELDRLSSTITS